MKYRYAVYVSGGGTFKRLLEEFPDLSSGIKLCVCDSLRGSFLSSACAERGIAFFQCPFANLPGNDKNQILSNVLYDFFRLFSIDYCFSFGGHILKSPLIDEYYGRIINLHPGQCPKYKGLNAIDRAIQNGEKELFNTAHFIDEGIDSGEIILQRSISSDVYYSDGYKGVLAPQLEMINEIVIAIEKGVLKEQFGLISI